MRRDRWREGSYNPTRFFAIVCMMLAACAAPRDEKTGRQARQPPAAETFTFSAHAERLGHDADDPRAERDRLNTLEQHLRANQMCPKGYALTSRHVIIQIGEKDQIDYVGRCTA